MDNVVKTYEEQGQTLAQKEGQPNFVNEARDFMHQYITMMIGPDNAREVTQQIIELEGEAIGMYLSKWDIIFSRAHELNDSMSGFEDPTKQPCHKFILGNCRFGDNCRYSHINCKEIRDCGCCKHDVLGQCKFG